MGPSPAQPSTTGNDPTPTSTPTLDDPEPPRDPGQLGSPNLFAELIGKGQAEIDSKVKTAVERFFGVGTGESTTPNVDDGYRCYYELPQDSSKAFIWAADSDDIRSEGMSFGMMIALQMGMQQQFDKLWRFAREYMQYSASSSTSAWRYYFAWQGTVDRTDASSWSVSFGTENVPAPDGDEYFAAALYLADQRWGSDGEIDYHAEAANISRAMLHNPAGNGRFPIIHERENMVVFVPYGNSNEFTDPSYHLPAFYELFGLYGPAEDAAQWRSVAETSREFLVDSAHATTGLHPDYASFDGAPKSASSGDGHDRFQYDAWRVVMNMAVDYAWFGQDARMKDQVEKYHAFFADHLGQNNVSASLFSVDGSGATGGGSTGLTGTLAVGAMASDHSDKATFVTHLWNIPQQQGRYRYYQECLYLLSLLHVSGNFHYAW
jgi:oligosaccharide reducing-end xylanase